MQQKAKYPHLQFMPLDLHKHLLKCNSLFFITISLFFIVFSAHAQSKHGMAMHGALEHPGDFQSFSYTDSQAKKGGRLNKALIGTFDSLNPLISNGVPVQEVRNYVYETLMSRSYGEPFSLYGLLAEKVEMADDRSWVTFFINPQARFSDGKQVTVDDVIFSHALLRDKGRPNHRTYYSKVVSVEKIGDNAVKFKFQDGNDREIPLIMGLMPILPKHLIDSKTFPETSLKIPVGSGPYKISKIKAGKLVLFERDKNYWGKDLPVNKFRFNFDEIQIQYYRSQNAMFEAFKRGLYHQHYEGRPDKWKLAYNFPAIKAKQVLKKEIPLYASSGMDALVFNTRRPQFQDRRVRQALLYLFDSSWINRTLFHNLYTRTQSFFDRSELSSHKKPADDYEKKILKPFIDQIDPKILNGTYVMPGSEGSRGNRRNVRKALRLFKEAGYELKSGKLINTKTGKQLSFEILIARRDQERLILTYALALRKVGIEVKLRHVDAAQFELRKNNFNYDIIQNFWSASLSPGNEQLFRWSISAAKTQGSFNFPGVKSPAVDTMIKELLAARNRKDFVSSVRSLDRALLSGTYVIPLFHSANQWIAHWKHLKCPEKASLYGFRIDTCWIENEQ